MVSHGAPGGLGAPRQRHRRFGAPRPSMDATGGSSGLLASVRRGKARISMGLEFHVADAAVCQTRCAPLAGKLAVPARAGS